MTETLTPAEQDALRLVGQGAIYFEHSMHGGVSLTSYFDPSGRSRTRTLRPLRGAGLIRLGPDGLAYLTAAGEIAAVGGMR